TDDGEYQRQCDGLVAGPVAAEQAEHATLGRRGRRHRHPRRGGRGTAPSAGRPLARRGGRGRGRRHGGGVLTARRERPPLGLVAGGSAVLGVSALVWHGRNGIPVARARATWPGPGTSGRAARDDPTG